MDLLDVRIIQELGGRTNPGPFPSSIASLRKLGASVGVDKDTVKSRLENLRRRGIFLGWHAMINPNLLSLKVTRIWHGFSSEKTKEEGIRMLLQIPNVRIIYDYLGNSISFVVALGKMPTGPKEITQDGFRKPWMEGFKATMRFPKSDFDLTEKDWRIYRSLRNNPSLHQRLISKETGIPSRTVRRRLAAMVNSHALLIAPNWDAGKVEGVATEILLECAEDQTDTVANDVLAEAGDYLIHSERFEEPCVLFSLIPQSVSKAQSTFRKVRRFPGVTGARFDIVHEVIRPRMALVARHSSPS